MLETFKLYFIEYEGYKDYFTGLKNTAIIAVFGLLIGFVIGCLIATVKIIPKKNLGLNITEKLCDVYVALFRGTPMTVQLLLLHFAIFPIIGLDISTVAEAVLIFGMNSGAYMAEILRSGINAVDKGQMEASRSLGLGFVPSMLRIILPQAIKNILPTLGNEFIVLLKETSVAGYIALQDLTKGGDIIRSQTYDAFFPLIAVALIYLVVVMFLSWLLGRLEKRLKRNE